MMKSGTEPVSKWIADRMIKSQLEMYERQQEGFYEKMRRGSPEDFERRLPDMAQNIRAGRELYEQSLQTLSPRAKAARERLEQLRAKAEFEKDPAKKKAYQAQADALQPEVDSLNKQVAALEKKLMEYSAMEMALAERTRIAADTEREVAAYNAKRAQQTRDPNKRTQEGPERTQWVEPPASEDRPWDLDDLVTNLNLQNPTRNPLGENVIVMGLEPADWQRLQKQPNARLQAVTLKNGDPAFRITIAGRDVILVAKDSPTHRRVQAESQVQADQPAYIATEDGMIDLRDRAQDADVPSPAAPPPSLPAPSTGPASPSVSIDLSKPTGETVEDKLKGKLQSGKTYRVTREIGGQTKFEEVSDADVAREGEVRVKINSRWLGLSKSVGWSKRAGDQWVPVDVPSNISGDRIPDAFGTWTTDDYTPHWDAVSQALQREAWLEPSKREALLAKLRTLNDIALPEVLALLSSVLNSASLSIEWKQRITDWILSSDSGVWDLVRRNLNKFASSVGQIEGADINQYLDVIYKNGDNLLLTLFAGTRVLEYLNNQSQLSPAQKLEFLTKLKSKAGGDLDLAWDRTVVVAALSSAVRSNPAWSEIAEPFKNSDRVWLPPSADANTALKAGRQFIERAVALNFPYEVALRVAYRNGMFHAVLDLGAANHVLGNKADGDAGFFTLAHNHPGSDPSVRWPSYTDIVSQQKNAERIEAMIARGELPANLEIPGVRTADGVYSSVVLSNLGAVRLESRRSADGSSWETRLYYADGKEATAVPDAESVTAEVNEHKDYDSYGRYVGDKHVNIPITEVVHQGPESFTETTRFTPATYDVEAKPVDKTQYTNDDIVAAADREMVGGFQNRLPAPRRTPTPGLMPEPAPAVASSTPLFPAFPELPPVTASKWDGASRRTVEIGPGVRPMHQNLGYAPAEGELYVALDQANPGYHDVPVWRSYTETNPERFGFVHGDINALPFPDASVDEIVMNGSHGNLEMHKVQEADRVTKPGGLIRVGILYSSASSLGPWVQYLKSLGYKIEEQRTYNYKDVITHFNEVNGTTWETHGEQPYFTITFRKPTEAKELASPSKVSPEFTEPATPVPSRVTPLDSVPATLTDRAGAGHLSPSRQGVVADFRSAAEPLPVKVGTGQAAVVRADQRVSTNDLGGCIGVLIVGPHGTVLVHMMPNHEGWGYFGYLEPYTQASVSSILTQSGISASDLAQSRVLLVSNVPATISDLPSRHQQLTNLAKAFTSAGAVSIDTVEVPLLRTTVSYDPATGVATVFGNTYAYDGEGTRIERRGTTRGYEVDVRNISGTNGIQMVGEPDMSSLQAAVIAKASAEGLAGTVIAYDPAGEKWDNPHNRVRGFLTVEYINRKLSASHEVPVELEETSAWTNPDNFSEAHRDLIVLNKDGKNIYLVPTQEDKNFLLRQINDFDPRRRAALDDTMSRVMTYEEFVAESVLAAHPQSREAFERIVDDLRDRSPADVAALESNAERALLAIETLQSVGLSNVQCTLLIRSYVVFEETETTGQRLPMPVDEVLTQLAEWAVIFDAAGFGPNEISATLEKLLGRVAMMQHNIDQIESLMADTEWKAKDPEEKRADLERLATEVDINFRIQDPWRAMRQLEDEMGFPIWCDVPLDNSMLASVAEVLGEIRDARPADFSLIKGLDISMTLPSLGRSHTSSDRLDTKTLMHNGYLFVRNPWDTKYQHGLTMSVETGEPGYTKERMNNSYASWPADFGADPKAFMRYVLMHELGHTVDSQHEEFYGRTFSGRDSKEVQYDDKYILEEVIAEDYRCFLMSGGTEVLRTNRAGEEIPFYAERLAHWQEWYRDGHDVEAADQMHVVDAEAAAAAENDSFDWGGFADDMRREREEREEAAAAARRKPKSGLMPGSSRGEKVDVDRALFEGNPDAALPALESAGYTTVFFYVPSEGEVDCLAHKSEPATLRPLTSDGTQTVKYDIKAEKQVDGSWQWSRFVSDAGWVSTDVNGNALDVYSSRIKVGELPVNGLDSILSGLPQATQIEVLNTVYGCVSEIEGTRSIHENIPYRLELAHWLIGRMDTESVSLLLRTLKTLQSFILVKSLTPDQVLDLKKSTIEKVDAALDKIEPARLQEGLDVLEALWKFLGVGNDEVNQKIAQKAQEIADVELSKPGRLKDERILNLSRLSKYLSSDKIIEVSKKIQASLPEILDPDGLYSELAQEKAIYMMGNLALLAPSEITATDIKLILSVFKNPSYAEMRLSSQSSRAGMMTQYDAVALNLLAIFGMRPDLAEVGMRELQDVLAAETDLLPAARDAAILTLASLLANRGDLWTSAEGWIIDGLRGQGALTATDAAKILHEMIRRNPDRLDLHVYVNIASDPSVKISTRTRLLHEVIEPLFFRRPGDLTVGDINALADVLPVDVLGVFLFAVATRPGIDDAVRRCAQGHIDALKEVGNFPLHDIALSALAPPGAKEVLFVQDMADGYGDEQIRTLALIQALLAFNPQLKVTLITPRVGAFKNPLPGEERLTVIDNGAQDQYGPMLKKKYDMVVYYQFEQDLHVEDPMRDAMSSMPKPAIYIKGGAYANHQGWTKNVGITDVEVSGHNYADELGLNANPTSVYDPTLRLMTELGLAYRAGEESPPAGEVMAGVGSEACRRAWNDLNATNTDGRPVALLNPFGGQDASKGYQPIQRAPGLGFSFMQLKAIMIELVSKGYQVVITPTGGQSVYEEWGTSNIAEYFLNELPPEVAKHVVIAPDAKALPRGALNEFAAQADLIVTTEGGMGHAAYNLGKPVRVILLPGSGEPDWMPNTAGNDQRLITGFDLENEIPPARGRSVTNTQPDVGVPPGGSGEVSSNPFSTVYPHSLSATQVSDLLARQQALTALSSDTAARAAASRRNAAIDDPITPGTLVHGSRDFTPEKLGQILDQGLLCPEFIGQEEQHDETYFHVDFFETEAASVAELQERLNTAGGVRFGPGSDPVKRMYAGMKWYLPWSGSRQPSITLIVNPDVSSQSWQADQVSRPNDIRSPYVALIPGQNQVSVLGGVASTDIVGIVISPAVNVADVIRELESRGMYIPIYDTDGTLLYGSEDSSVLR